MGTVVAAIVGVAFIAYGVWMLATPAGRAFAKESKERKAAKMERPVPIKNGVPTCSKCGGTQFTARRKTSTKVMFGLASLAGKPHHVECEVCGQRYARPNV